MNAVLAATLAFFPASVSAADLPREVVPNTVKSESTFAPTGTVSESEMRLNSVVRVNTIETGEKDGVAYRIYYSDGSGSFAGAPGNTLAARESDNWSVGCSKDAMDDTRSCRLYKGDLWVWAYSNGRRRVMLSGDHYPGYAAQVRVDGQAPISSPNDSDGVFGPQGSKSAITQMLRGESVSTRYVDWPYRSNVDKTESLYGFKQAYEYLEWALRNTR